MLNYSLSQAKAVLDHLLSCKESRAVVFGWQKKDIAMLDALIAQAQRVYETALDELKNPH